MFLRENIDGPSMSFYPTCIMILCGGGWTGLQSFLCTRLKLDLQKMMLGTCSTIHRAQRHMLLNPLSSQPHMWKYKFRFPGHCLLFWSILCYKIKPNWKMLKCQIILFVTQYGNKSFTYLCNNT